MTRRYSSRMFGFTTSVALLASYLLLLPASAGAEQAGLSASTADTSSESDVDALVERAFENLYGFSSIQDVRLIASASGQQFERSAQVIRQAASSGLNRMLVRFAYPQEMRGLGILLRERPTFQYDAFVYQPSLDKVRRVSLYQREDQFFGTDLAFEDLEGKRPFQWKRRFLRAELVDGRNTVAVELTPFDFPSGYERLIAWFDKDLPIIAKLEFYKDSKLFKTATMPVDRVVEQGNYHIPTRLEFESGNGTRTVVEVSRIELVEKIPPNRFTTTALEFGNKKRDAKGLR